MKLIMSNNSPYARRARITVREAGLDEQVEEVMIKSFAELPSYGPGGKIPVLITDTGQSICEALIITRYLNAVANAGLVPTDSDDLEVCLALESTASVLMDSLFARSFEKNQRDEASRSTAVLEREQNRSQRCYDTLDQASLQAGTNVTVASIAIIAALGYADWRAQEDQWRTGRAGLANYFDQMMTRPAFAATKPVY
ncbi:MAG: hypothetical protein GKR90_09825 [Pseudomonadales bacterium]|nr:hypothetical protein [Pseudomonadales bacterium]